MLLYFIYLPIFNSYILEECQIQFKFITMEQRSSSNMMPLGQRGQGCVAFASRGGRARGGRGGNRPLRRT
jgi:hypothetical protein